MQTWVHSPVLGDMLVETAYSNCQKFDGGVSFPMRIVQHSGGYPSLDLWITTVQPNAMVNIEVPGAVRTAAPPAAVMVEAQKIADGVYWLTGGSHHSVAIDMRDHVIVVEGPQNEERSLAVIARIKETIPNKPIRGLRTPAPPAAPPAASAPPQGGDGMTPLPVPTISPTILHLYQNIQRLKLDVAQIAALHGQRLATLQDLATAAGRGGTN